MMLSRVICHQNSLARKEQGETMEKKDQQRPTYELLVRIQTIDTHPQENFKKERDLV